MATQDPTDELNDLYQTAENTDTTLSTKRAFILLAYQRGYGPTELGDYLGIAKSTVANQKRDANKHVKKAEETLSLVKQPDYLSEVGSGLGKYLYDSFQEDSNYPVAQLYGVNGDGGLSNGGYTVEFYTRPETSGYRGVEDVLMLVREENHRNDIVQSFQLNYYKVVQYIREWLMDGGWSNHIDVPNTPEEVTEWALVDTFDGELEEQLEKANIEREHLSETRPHVLEDTRVYVDEMAKTGLYHDGYRIAYIPADSEDLD